MTGNDIVRQALGLLGYADRCDGGVPGGERLHKRALAYVNHIAADVWYIGSNEPFVPLTDLGAPLPFSPRVIHTVLPLGVAMLFAQAEGDGDNQTLYASLYDQRRSSAASASARVTDALPEVGE